MLTFFAHAVAARGGSDVVAARRVRAALLQRLAYPVPEVQVPVCMHIRMCVRGNCPTVLLLAILTVIAQQSRGTVVKLKNRAQCARSPRGWWKPCMEHYYQSRQRPSYLTDWYMPNLYLQVRRYTTTD